MNKLQRYLHRTDVGNIEYCLASDVSALETENERVREALYEIRDEICAICVYPSDPRKDGAFPQLENPADQECMARAIEIIKEALLSEQEKQP